MTTASSSGLKSFETKIYVITCWFLQNVLVFLGKLETNSSFSILHLLKTFKQNEAIVWEFLT